MSSGEATLAVNFKNDTLPTRARILLFDKMDFFIEWEFFDKSKLNEYPNEIGGFDYVAALMFLFSLGFRISRVDTGQFIRSTNPDLVFDLPVNASDRFKDGL